MTKEPETVQQAVYCEGCGHAFLRETSGWLTRVVLQGMKGTLHCPSCGHDQELGVSDVSTAD